MSRLEAESPLDGQASPRTTMETHSEPTDLGDMNILGRALNVPIVTYGPGDSHLDHTKDEHIIISEYLDGIQVYKKTLLKLAELHKKTGSR